MELFPSLHLGWLNGWLFLLFIYLSTEWLARRLPNNVSARLFDRSGCAPREEMFALLASIPNLVYIVLMVLTPLKVGTWLLSFGAAVTVVGTSACTHSILMFVTTPAGEPVTRSLYRISRNPQIVGMFLALIGSCLACGSWVALSIIMVWGWLQHSRVLAEERTCLAEYGEAYRVYMHRVRRYLIL